ncbi:MAG TPA: Amuc_1100 family pilus-like protein [Chthoniobacterales bacterium]
MNWYRENRWLGNFLIAFGLALFFGLWFLFYARGSFADAMTEFNAAATERSRLEHLNPFPNEENFKKTQAALENYGAHLNKLKEELKAQVLPAAPMQPNEFQTHLRQAIANTAEKARTNRVRLPDNFHLGFEEFVNALPGTAETPVLGQELQQIELLVGILIELKVDAITNLRRKSPSTETAAAATPAPKAPANAPPTVVERTTVDLTFAASPSSLRKVLNQIASSERQFFVVRTLYVHNEQAKAPTREQNAPAAAANAATSPGALKFIVGNEHVDATAAVELVRFTF